MLNIEAIILEIKETKEFTKFGIKGKIAKAIIETKDKKRYILNLWNEQIGLVKVGDEIKILNGYIKKYKGEENINVNNFGKIEIIKSKIK